MNADYNYRLVKEDGEVIEKFRNLRVCKKFKKEWEKFTDEELKIEVDLP